MRSCAMTGYSTWSNESVSGVADLLGLYVINRSGRLDGWRLELHFLNHDYEADFTIK